ncbi:TetR/AcrR family transcriptional regulator [Williamsia sp. CHRR-6]|uniref:TetR/AcrR family transcriptional regulator n=1 Tax=Williamsia sp. CHRR-6 TaxID=2835871 RepID=UPI001BD91E48|nr:TetR/AcrR family transcriptional regulator [Williamsia sp. CHRR-6]MBT0566117.1 TetR/AcrR family transcriptional regulator [Williamsia sp. CHRR-6]
MMAEPFAVRRRLPARADELLDGAIRAFSRGGYDGTSTAEVAKEMGVSQPYVVSAFGSKESLFIETHRHATDKMLAAFRSAKSDEFDPSRVGMAYKELVFNQPEALRIYNYGFAAVKYPAIAAEVRRVFGEVCRTLEDLGATTVQIRDFLARGFLINAVLSSELPSHADDLGLTDFILEVFGSSNTVHNR